MFSQQALQELHRFRAVMFSPTEANPKYSFFKTASNL